MKKKSLIPLILIVSLYSFSQNKLPNIDLATIDGDKVKLSDEINKKGLTVVSLWATWCVPCLKELDAISEVYNDWQDETHVSLVAVSVDDSRTVKRVKPLINGKGWDYKILLDTNNNLKRALNASNIPLTILVKNNNIVYEHTGYVPGSEDELYKKIQEHSK